MIERSNDRMIEWSKDRSINANEKKKKTKWLKNKTRTFCFCAQMMLKWWYWRHRSRRELVLEVLRKYEFWRSFGHLGRTVQPSMTSSHSRQHLRCDLLWHHLTFSVRWKNVRTKVAEGKLWSGERPLARALLLFGLRWCGLFHPDVKWEPLKCANNDKK